MSYIKDLSANVTLYGQKTINWCGPACAQMIRYGYPNVADRLFYEQVDLWQTIGAYNNGTLPGDSGWNTNPKGLKGCLQSLAPPPGTNWAEFSNPDKHVVLFDILYWMNRREYPCAALINEGAHWVTIVAFETDIEPLAGTTPVLEYITIYDPLPVCTGTITRMTSDQWLNGVASWGNAVDYPGTWDQKYVAIVEPPIGKGVVRVKRQAKKRIGKDLRSPDVALEDAKRWVKELKLAERPKYGLLGNKSASAGQPILVREGVPGGRKKKAAFYYIVPFGLKGESNDRGEPMVRVCVLVNAYTGEFEEVTAFGRPIHYLSSEGALDVVGAALHVDRKSLTGAETTLLFQPSEITHVRAWPFWQVKIGQRTFYVDQSRKLYGNIPPSKPGS